MPQALSPLTRAEQHQIDYMNALDRPMELRNENPEEPEPTEPEILEKLLGLTEKGLAVEVIEEYHAALKRGVPMETCGFCYGLETVCGSCGGVGEVPAMSWDPEQCNGAEDF